MLFETRMRLEYKNSRIAAEIDICIYSIEPLTNVFKFETLKLSLICITADNVNGVAKYIITTNFYYSQLSRRTNTTKNDFVNIVNYKWKKFQ